MIEPSHLRELVINPALKCMEEQTGKLVYSNIAIELLMMTAATESSLGTYLKQGYENVSDMSGIALGIYMIEPKTHSSLWENCNLLKKYYPHKIPK